MNKYIIYSDGACRSNNKSGGCASIIQDLNSTKIFEIFCGWCNTTNNRMELQGVIQGLDYIKESSEITVVSDSQYVVNTINNNWLDRMLKDPDGYANMDLWQILSRLLTFHKVTFVWTKGHADNEMNNRADKLAQHASKMLNLPEDEYFNNCKETGKSLVPESETRWPDGSYTRSENGEIMYSLG